MKFFAKVYRIEKEVMLAACDSGVYGKSFEAGGVVVEVSKEFYGTKSYDKDGIIPVMEEATILNLVGKRIIDLAIESGMIEKGSVIEVGDTVHAQMVRV